MVPSRTAVRLTARLRGVALAIGAVAVLLAGSASAQQRQARASLDVTARVISNCRLLIDSLVFGTYDPLGLHASTPLESSTRMIVTCTRNTRATISFDAGRHPGTDSLRRLAAGPERLGYELFRDSARTQVWGDGVNALNFSADSNHGGEVTIYGRVPPAQELPAGVYADVVTATVDF